MNTVLALQFWGRSSLYGGRILDDEEKKGAVSSVAQDGDDDSVWWLMNQYRHHGSKDGFLFPPSC